MDENIFSNSLKLIRENPQRAREFVDKWQSFVTKFGTRFPDLRFLQSRKEWLEWTKLHDFAGSENLWIGKEVSDAYFYAHEDNQERIDGEIDRNNLPTEMLGLPLGFLSLAFRKKNRVLELDDKYINLAQKHKKEWLKENGVEENSNEWIKYRYGDWGAGEPSEYEKRLGLEFGKKNPERAAFYEKEKKKIYKKTTEDPYVKHLSLKIAEETKVRQAQAKKANPGISDRMLGSIQRGIALKHWEHFAQKYPEKTKSYKDREGADYSVLKDAHNFIRRTNVQEPKASFQTPPAPTGRSSLLERASIPSFSSPGRVLNRVGNLGGNLSSLASSFPQAGRLLTFATIGWPVAVAIIVPAVIVFLILMSTPGISGQQAEVATAPSPSPSLAPAPKANINFYCQYDPKWTSSECDITRFGCDPTSIAIILGSFGDKEWTPKEVALRNDSMGCFRATSKNQTIEALRWTKKTLGYKVAGLGDEDDDSSGYLVNDEGNFNFLRAKKFLGAGYLIHAGAVVTFKSNGIKRGGHSFVITDVNPQAKEITAYDPTYCFTDSDLGIRTITTTDLGEDGSDSAWFWAFPIKKEALAVK